MRRSRRLAGGQAPSLAGTQAAQAVSETDNNSIPVTEGPEREPEPEPEAKPFVGTYSMELAVTPPQRITAGLRLEAPLVVTFSASKVKKRALVPRELTDLSGIWAFVSLMTEDRSRSLAPPQTDLLRGRTADSIHHIPQAEGRDERPFAYATFPNLEIARPGRYCFKVNIIDMNQYVWKSSKAARANRS